MEPTWTRIQKRNVASGEANVFKRTMLTLTFAAAFGAAGLWLTDKADARSWRGNRPYVSYYYGPSAYYGYNYGYNVPYRSYYRGYYAPRSYYRDPGYYYYRSGPRVGVRVGPFWR